MIMLPFLRINSKSVFLKITKEFLMNLNTQITKQLFHADTPFTKQVNPVEISFVIIEYHCLDSVQVCFDSIRNACDKLGFEVVVSSNSMYDKQKQEIIRQKMSDAKWIFNDSNKGFAGGMNSGILMSSGKVIVLINPDVILSKCDMRSVLNYFMLHKNIGLIGPKIVDDQGNIQDSCRKFMGLKEFFWRMYKRLSLGKDVLLNKMFDYTAIQPVDWVIGAFMLVKREALAKVGLLDNNYFLYVEDMDWCKRFWNSGIQIVYYPEVEIVYKGDRKSTSSLITKRIINRYSYFHLKSYLRFLWKNRFQISRTHNYPLALNNSIVSTNRKDRISNI